MGGANDAGALNARGSPAPERADFLDIYRF